MASFFNELNKKEGFGKDEKVDIQSLVNYFHLWSENAEILNLRSSANMDKVIINRMRIQFSRIYENKIKLDFSDLNPILAGYIFESLVYANFRLLQYWVESGKIHSPEVMGSLMYELSGPKVIKRITAKFKDIIQ